MSAELPLTRRLLGERAALLKRLAKIDVELQDPLRWSVLRDLAEGPQDIAWLAETAGATSEATRAKLRTLLREGIVVRVRRGLYGLSRQRCAR